MSENARWFHAMRRTVCEEERAFHKGDGFVYIAEIVGRSAIKIGYSIAPERRLLQFNSRLKVKTRLLCMFPSSQQSERGLHCRLSSYRHPDFPNTHEIYPASALCSAWVPSRVRLIALHALARSAQQGAAA